MLTQDSNFAKKLKIFQLQKNICRYVKRQAEAKVKQQSANSIN